MDAITELKAKRDALVLEKRTLESKLAAVRNLVRSSGRMPHDKYKACCDSQTDYTRRIVGVEARILEVKREIQRLADIQHAEYMANNTHNGVSTRKIIDMIREVRDKWQELSCDDSLGNSTERTQAAQFVRDLNPIIHTLLDPPSR